MHAPGLLRTHCPLALHVEPGGHGTIGPHCGPVVALHWPLTHACPIAQSESARHMPGFEPPHTPLTHAWPAAQSRSLMHALG
jgi:hypothetical protein